jgi:hypothetical protein
MSDFVAQVCKAFRITEPTIVAVLSPSEKIGKTVDSIEDASNDSSGPENNT